MKFPISWSHPVAARGLPTRTAAGGEDVEKVYLSVLSVSAPRTVQGSPGPRDSWQNRLIRNVLLHCVPATASSIFGDVPDLSVEWAINNATDKRE